MDSDGLPAMPLRLSSRNTLFKPRLAHNKVPPSAKAAKVVWLVFTFCQYWLSCVPLRAAAC